MNLPIRCSKCKRIAIYISKEYFLTIPVVCNNCHSGKKTKKKTKTVTSIYANIKKGIRKDIHSSYYFRSPTEANFARILQLLKIQWKFEERNFSFGGYKRRPFVYLMDFTITNNNKYFPSKYYEIKGYMNSQSRQKLRRLKKCYPKEFSKTTVVIYTKYRKKDIQFCKSIGCEYIFYDELTKQFKDKIPMWE